MAVFPSRAEINGDFLTAVLNSRFVHYVLTALNPTLHIGAGEARNLPLPIVEHSKRVHLETLAEDAIALSKAESHESDKSYDFVQPLRTLPDRLTRRRQLAVREAEIDAEVSRLYGLTNEDLAAIDRELKVPASITDDAEEDQTEGNDSDDIDADGDLSPADLARSWLSYALGTVLGRFDIGQPGGLGCGDFLEATAAQIHPLIDPDSIMPSETGHPQDLAARVFACLELMLGSGPARNAVFNATFTAGEPIEALRGWLDRFAGTPAASFWKYHHPLYRKRPVYWPFQSPRKTYAVWVFHEKLGPNTLHTIKEFADVRLNLLERSEIPPLRLAAATNRAKERELQKLLEQSDDLREFSARLQAHIESGYQSCIDDGVLLNAAPLYDLFPSWPDTKKAWEELKAGKYDWAHQAMRYWPERVAEACRTNRSFAIAHGREDLCPAAPPRATRPRGRQPADLTDIV